MQINPNVPLVTAQIPTGQTRGIWMQLLQIRMPINAVGHIVFDDAFANPGRGENPECFLPKRGI